MWNLFGVVVFHRFMVNWRRGPWYMCIVLYVKLMWCSGFLLIYGWLEEGVHVPEVYVHSAICATYLVYWYAMHLWSIAGGTFALSIFAFCYILNLFGVVILHRSMANWRRRALVYVYSAICKMYLVYWYSIDLWSIGGGGLDICAFCYMWNVFGVVVCCRPMVDWRGLHVP